MSEQNDSEKKMESISDAVSSLIRLDDEIEDDTEVTENYKEITKENFEKSFNKKIEHLNSKISVAEVDTFIQSIQGKTESLFANKLLTDDLSDLNSEEKQILLQKIQDWQSPEEIGSINARAFISWLNREDEDDQK